MSSVNKDYLKNLVPQAPTPEVVVPHTVATASMLDFEIEKRKRREQNPVNMYAELWRKVEKIAKQKECSRNQVIEKILEKALG